MPVVSAAVVSIAPATTISNPIYLKWLPVWNKLKDVYDGTGGFQDGTYLVAHPREWKDHTATVPTIPTAKLKARRALARYENIAAPILDQKRTALFRSPITRTVGGQAKAEKDNTHPIENWWANVDGSPGKCSIDQWMAEAFVAAGLFGHVFHYMDRPAGMPAETAADEPELFLRLYAPADVPDWLMDDRGQLTAVRLLEPQPRTDLYSQQSNLRPRERVVTETYWELRESGKTGGAVVLTRGDHDFGTLPIVVQYASRRALTPLIGQSVLGDPQLYLDCYNLTSEIRELLRNQTFGMMNVPLGTTADRVSVVEAQTMMGDEKGSENVLFTPGPAAYIQPDTGNVTVYQDERRDLIRTIYRLASVPFESDSKDAEAEGSLKLKREDMNQILAGYASECEKAEYQIAKMWFRGTYGPDAWEAEWDKAEVQIQYPQTFDVTPFAEILEQAQAAVSLEMGPKFMAEQRKRLVPKFLPDLPPSTKQEIEQEIETIPVKSPAQQKLEEMAMRFGGKPGQPGQPQPAPGGVGV